MTISNGANGDALKVCPFLHEDLIEIFTQAKGVGRWPVEMMLILSLGRLDVLSIDGYGVRAGYTEGQETEHDRDK